LLSNSVQRGAGVSVITIVLYLAAVVLTTPGLKPVDAISASVALNWWVIGGVSAGTGTQAFLLSLARSRACAVKHGRTAASASGFFSGLSSLVSFVTLIPLGCCGTWVYVLSFLPGLIGTGASGFLVAESLQLEVAGLGLMTMSVAYTYLSLRNRSSNSRLPEAEGYRISKNMRHLELEC
jgi:hypothetical protein